MTIPANTFVELIDHNRRLDRSVVYLEGEQVERRVRYAELWDRARGILYHLQKLGAQRGDKLILFLGNNEQFIDAFWAAVLGGIVPVPVALGISDEHRHKLFRIAKKLGRAFLYTDSKSLDRLRAFADEAGQQQAFGDLKSRTFTVDRLSDISTPGQVHLPSRSDPLFIQFSSGSTSEPKGVVLTHGNVLENAQGTIDRARFTPEDSSLSWMPLTHDMGLIGFHLFMFARGIDQYLMPTELFVRRPLLWMEFASRTRATLTCSPNFGYRHFLKVLGDRSVEHLDLSQVKLIFNGAEPIAVDLCEDFLQRMAPAKLDRKAMYPVYGLAEASLAVTFPEPGQDYQFATLDRHHLGVGQTAVRIARGDRGALDLMAVGRPVPPCEVLLTDDQDGAVAEGRVGHILIRGGNVTGGYFEDAATNTESFAADGWLRTGDLGLHLDGNLYITGRAKDIIFVNGQNFYPHDLEAIGLHAPGLELNKIAVAAVRAPQAEAEEVAAFVLHRGALEDFIAVADAVARLINEHAGVEVSYVIPVKRIPKTTSGKLQRHLLAQGFADGEFATEWAELQRLRGAAGGGTGKPAHGDLALKLKQICDAALPDERIGLDDNLFETGVSSLKLIEIHEGIDREFPGLIDLTELFDYPTIAELAKHMETKLAAA